MADLELTRAPDDRRLYVLDGVGRLRFERRLTGRPATAEAGDRRWRLSKSMWRRAVEATDEAGAIVGTFDPRALRRGGALVWTRGGRRRRGASRWRERYAWADGDGGLALFDARGWGKRPVRIPLADPGAVEPGLVLFAAFVVRGLAEDASAAATAASAGVVASG